MRRYIDADALIEAIKNELWDWDSLDGITSAAVLKQTLTDIQNAPTADVRENVHAHWEKAYGDSRFMCSVCKGKENVPTIMGKPIVWGFCPNCGAAMEGNDGKIH